MAIICHEIVGDERVCSVQVFGTDTGVPYLSALEAARHLDRLEGVAMPERIIEVEHLLAPKRYRVLSRPSREYQIDRTWRG